MPVNEFEKQVQKIMSELKLRPSAPSWDNIESELRKKREKRRVIIIWFIVLCLVLGGGLWMIIGTNHERMTAKNDSAILTNEQTVTNNSGATKKLNQENFSNITTARDQNKISSLDPSVKVSKSQRLSTNKQDAEQKDKNMPGRGRQNEIDSKQTNEGAKALSQNQIQPELKNQKPKVDSVSSFVGEKNETVVETIPNQTEPKEPLIKTDSAVGKNQTNEQTDVATKDKKPQTQKWQKHITAEIGWSNYTDGIFGGPKSLNYSASPASGPGPVASGGIPTPNPITRGLSFALGVGFSKVLGKRANLNLGLQYHYYSTHIITGDKVKKDTTINFGGDVVNISEYYKNGNQNNYTNHFHVLEIPVSVDYRLFKNFPLDLGVGLSYGYLINTNALTFNYQKNIYYPNPKNYVKSYFNGFSSLQYTWLQNSKVKIQSGPVVLYNFIELQHESYYSIPHLVSFGIGTNIKF